MTHYRGDLVGCDHRACRPIRRTRANGGQRAPMAATSRRAAEIPTSCGTGGRQDEVQQVGLFWAGRSERSCCGLQLSLELHAGPASRPDPWCGGSALIWRASSRAFPERRGIRADSGATNRPGSGRHARCRSRLAGEAGSEPSITGDADRGDAARIGKDRVAVEGQGMIAERHGVPRARVALLPGVNRRRSDRRVTPTQLSLAFGERRSGRDRREE